MRVSQDDIMTDFNKRVPRCGPHSFGE